MFPTGKIQWTNFVFFQMGFSDNEGKHGNFAEQYNSRREHHLSSLQQKEEEMRQKFVIRVKEKEADLKEAEKEVSATRKSFLKVAITLRKRPGEIIV